MTLRHTTCELVTLRHITTSCNFIAIPIGKMVVFRAVIVGNPTPEVTWTRNKGEIDNERYHIVYDKSSGEHQLQVGPPL